MTDPRLELPGQGLELPGQGLELPGQARLAVLGSPIAHSKSPAIHTAAYRVLGLGWEYGRAELLADELEGFLADRGSEWRGFSVTMPLKEQAHRLSAVLDPVAIESGVVNTLLRVTGSGSKPAWAGFNTDVLGLARAIEAADLDPTRAVVLGSGATAVSAVLALRRIGAERVTIAARNTEAANALVARFDGSGEPGAARTLEVSAAVLAAAEVSVLAERAEAATLVVSTLPAGAAAALELPEALLRLPLFDVAYEPWPSPLAERWLAAGGTVIAGIGMLVEQALLQLRIFVHGDPATPLTDERAVSEAMRRAAGMAGMSPEGVDS